jgi:hypothetical protein
MKQPTVIDGFLFGPEHYRRKALEMDYRSYHFEHCVFHGIAIDSAEGLVPSLIRELYPAAKPTLSFFRRSPEGQEEPHFIHSDADMGDWTAVLYLNPEPPDGDGTDFWTHRATGAIGSRIPHERSEEGKSTHGWFLRERVAARFNRIVLFPSIFFHSRAIHRNWSRGEEARLTQVVFGTGEIL